MSTIEEVKQKTDIVEIVGQYVTLRKSGRNFSAPCPFHSEKHPSFFVYPEQQSWHCFGACNTGGDVISFIMKKENMDFGDALRLLADRAGITLPDYSHNREEKDERDRFLQINDAAALYFHNNLLNSPAAETARDYVKKRGYTGTTVTEFQLGYSLNEWETLKHYLMKEKSYEEKELVAAGLLYENEDGRTTDRFRGKLMIPIRDRRGRVTGFGARVLDNSLPKYVNSPQTPTFDKSGTLFAIDRASSEIRKQDKAIIMEGYMDVMTAHQNGITNTVASMGTAITDTQVTILKKLSRNLVLAMDADAAGEEAMLRTVGHENTLNAEICVVVLPEGKDPDDVIRENPAAWQELISKAVPLLDFLFSSTVKGMDLTTARDKSKAVEKLLPVIGGVADPIRQVHYLQKLATAVNVDMTTMKASLARLKPAPVKRRAPLSGAAATAPSARPLVPTSREEYLLTLLLHHPGLKDREEKPEPGYFISSENRELYRAFHEAGDTTQLKAGLDPSLHDHLDHIMNKNLPDSRNDIEQRYLDCLSHLKVQYLKTIAARKASLGETADETALLEEAMSISAQLREEDARRNRKRSSSRR